MRGGKRTRYMSIDWLQWMVVVNTRQRLGRSRKRSGDLSVTTMTSLQP